MDMSPDEILTCPFNDSHVILRSKMPKHLQKCEKNYFGPPLYKCPFNVMHQFKTRKELRDHYNDCWDFGVNNVF